MVKLSDWLAAQRRKSADVNGKVDVALAFMRLHYGTDDDKVLSEVRCIDFSRAVQHVRMMKGEIFVAYKDPRVSPYKGSYFTRNGNSADRAGISTLTRPSYKDRDTGKTWSADTALERVIRRYEVMIAVPPTEVLLSYCAPAADTWSIEGKRVLAAGGGIQFLIPNANRFLRYIESPKHER